MNIYEAITELVNYGISKGLIENADIIYTTNMLLDALHLDEYKKSKATGKYQLDEILKSILDYACDNGLCENSVVYRDLFDTRIMGILTPRPSDVIKTFKSKYAESPISATDYYYNLSKSTDYIRTYRVKNDIKWVTKTPYGDIDITINMSKPEKDPKAIAAALTMKQSSYPKCMLCKENEGYSGRVNHPARENHRIIPIKIGGENWFFQYSPYVYYNEHSIVFNGEHTPMKIDKNAFLKLFDFVKMFPHYFVGSNADLPIVGGSILTHEHFQGGHYSFAMAKANIETPLKFTGYEDIDAGIVKWPMSVIRLCGKDTNRICDLGEKILNAWRGYSDEEVMIFSNTNGTPHNTITPIARCNDGIFELDLVLRNNITTDACPDGYFHPHPEYHHIKKENIGLIEVMGLAVLPSRLKTEMALLEDAMINGKDIESIEEIAKHKVWAEKIMSENAVTKDNCNAIIENEIGKVFAAILEQCGVYERNNHGKEHFIKFADYVNAQ